MPRHGENIYKRRDGRYEGRYVIGKTASGKLDSAMFTAINIQKYEMNCFKKRRLSSEHCPPKDRTVFFWRTG